MLILSNVAGSAPDSIEIITSAAVTTDVHASWVDLSGTTVTPGRTNTAISTATTTVNCVPAPASGVIRNVKTLTIRNRHATSSQDVTVQYDQNATNFELHKATLLAGEMLEYVEGVGFFTVQTERKALINRRVISDVALTNVTPTFADVTGLTCDVQSGKHYNFVAHLIHLSSGTTIGAQFGINGPAMTSLIVSTIDTVTASVTASAHSAGTVAALNTAATAQTTGAAGQVLGILTGWINPSADGTFAIRGCAEATGTVTVKAGSHLRLWEADN